jgi:hypothetical protein
MHIIPYGMYVRMYVCKTLLVQIMLLYQLKHAKSEATFERFQPFSSQHFLSKRHIPNREID